MEMQNRNKVMVVTIKAAVLTKLTDLPELVIQGGEAHSKPWMVVLIFQSLLSREGKL